MTQPPAPSVVPAVPESAAAPSLPRSVLLAGGGTAGHVEPALAVADALHAADPDIRITLLGTETGLESRLVPARGYDLALIPRVPLPRRLSGELFTVPARSWRAVTATGRIVEETQAQVIVGFGGYVAFPAYLAGRRRHVPLVVHEANPKPGLANRVGARLTQHVAVTAPATPLPHAVVTGLPLRASLLALDRAGERAAAAAAFGLDPGRPTLLVFGGSQGAQRLNEALLAAAADLTGAGIQVLHATGTRHYDAVRAALAAALPVEPASGPDRAGYVVRPYLDDMPRAYAAADLALTRAGAMTCAELAAVGLPAIYVPLPIGNGEQRLNALPAVEAGGGVLVEDAELTGERVVREVVPLLSEPERLAAVAAAARRSAHPDAARRLVAMIAAAASEAAIRSAR